MKKFSVVIGNPPYQTKSEASVTKTQAIWHKFVKKSIDMCEDDGYVCLVHPSGWRDVYGQFKDVRELLVSKDIKYLEMHNEKDGNDTFGAVTPYDYYILKNSDKKTLTTVKGQDGKISKLDMSNMKFIPNGMFDEISKLIALNEDEKINLLHDNVYHSQKDYISKERKENFDYPCIYNVKKQGLSLIWSSTNTRGHFNIPKVIFNTSANGGTSTVVDKSGEYGIAEFCSGIVDSPENLENIKKALDSKKFLELMKYCKTGTALLNRRVIALFRKDFWKEFVDENGKEI
jgi:hypothetical protein